MAKQDEINRRFLQHIANKQRALTVPHDLRAQIADYSDRTVSVGYVSGTLRRAFGANLPRVFPKIVAVDEPGWGANGSPFLGCGMVYPSGSASHPGLSKIFERNPSEFLFFELGFLASATSWSHSFRDQRPQDACLSFVFDDVAHYYMAEYPNRLIVHLNSAHHLEEQELRRARRNIERIVEHRISKYNAQPLVEETRGAKRRVLVVDQTYADGSTIYGLATDQVFTNMLLAAVRENPDAEILVKTHPDTIYEASRRRSAGGRPGFYSGLSDYENVRFVRDPVNPLALMETVDKVYVATSGMGFEALMMGKTVVCYGAPFYAGWGLTDDRQVIPNRHRARTLEELFYYFYIWYSHYVTPDSGDWCEIEDAIDYVLKHRPRQPTTSEVRNPRVSVIIPVYDVEQYIGDCLDSVLRQTLQDIEIIVVNDKSPDNSQEIVDARAATDQRIRSLILDENVGQGFARNRGLDIAQGEYIWFLDSDDLLADPTFLENAVNTAAADQADMVRGRKEIRDERGEEVVYRSEPVERLFSQPLHKLRLIDAPVLLQNNHFWNFLYRREFLRSKSIRFELTQWEERPFLLKALLEAKSISAVNVVATTYRMRIGSTARRVKTLTDVERRQDNFALCVDLFVERGARNPKSELYPLYQFCVSRWIPHFFAGFQLDFVRSLEEEADRTAFLNSLRKLLLRTGLSASELVSTPDNLTDDLFKKGHYQLLYAACRAGEFKLLMERLSGAKSSQQADYQVLLRSESHELVQALNRTLRFSPPAYDQNSVPFTAKPLPRIVLHIGSSKTGSTFIQHFCDDNRAVMAKQGVWYPEFGQFYQNSRPHKTAGHSDFVHAAKNEDFSLREQLHAGLTSLSSLGIQIHTIVLSSEAFFLTSDPGLLLTYLGEFALSVLVYLRRQEDWANSQYAEYVAGGAVSRTSLQPAQWLDMEITRQRMSYYSVLSRWREQLDGNKIIVRPYEKSQFVDGSLLGDFCAQVGIQQTSDLAVPSQRDANHFPFSTAEVAAIRSFNGLPFPNRGAYFRFIDEVERSLRTKNQAPPGKVQLLSVAERARIRKQYAEDNRLVCQQFLGRDGDLFLEEPTVTSDEDLPWSKSIPLEYLDIVFEQYKKAVKQQAHRGGKKRSPAHQANGTPEHQVPKSEKMESKVLRKLRKLKKNPRKFFADITAPRLRSLTRFLPSKS